MEINEKGDLVLVYHDYSLLGALREISTISGNYVNIVKSQKQEFSIEEAKKVMVKIEEILNLYQIKDYLKQVEEDNFKKRIFKEFEEAKKEKESFRISVRPERRYEK